MNDAFIPKQQYFLVHWSELEAAWRMLAAPSKQPHIDETVNALRLQARLGGNSGKEIFSVIAATAWLIDDETSSKGNLEP